MTFPDFGTAEPIFPEIPPRVTAGIADAMVTSTTEGSVTRRWALVTAVNANGTVDINIGGVAVPGIPRFGNYAPVVGDRVMVDVIGTDMIVVGPTAPSPRNISLNQRMGTVTGINANGTVNVNIDGTVYNNVPRLLSYYPFLNDSVRIVQDGSSTNFLVLGPIAGAALAHRQPTGTMGMTFAATPTTGCIFLQGQTLNRADYPTLWAWAVANAAAGFGNGNGTTTFTVPDMRGRVPVGVGTLGSDTYPLGGVGGATTKALSVAEMPQHKHDVSIANHSNHNHPMTGGNAATDYNAGNHGGHFPDAPHLAAAGPDVGAAAWNGGSGNVAHNHNVSVAVFSDSVSISAHSVTEANKGSGTAFDIRQPFIGLNYFIWV